MTDNIAVLEGYTREIRVGERFLLVKPNERFRAWDTDAQEFIIGKLKMANRTAEQVLASLREATEHTITDADGTQWGSVYLDNARGPESEKSFRACLAALSRKGLYKPQDGYAFGDVKLKGEA